MGRNIRTVGIPKVGFLRVFAAWMIFVAGGVVLTIAEPPTGRANAAAPVLGRGQACGPTYWHGAVDYETGRSSDTNYTCAIVDNTGGRSGTWTVPTGIVTYDVWLVGGGGGSGGVMATLATGPKCGRAGSAGGTYQVYNNRVRATSPTFNYTVGSSGSGGAAPSSAGGSSGGSGTQTIVDGMATSGGSGGNTNVQSPPCNTSWQTPSHWTSYGRGAPDHYGPDNGVGYAGYSGESGAVIITYSPTAPAAPGTPTTAFVSGAAGTVTASWSAPADVTYVARYVATATSSDGGTTRTCTTSMVGNTTPAVSCNISSLTAGKTYTVSVTAYTALDAASPASTASTSFVVRTSTLSTASTTQASGSTFSISPTVTLAGASPAGAGIAVTASIVSSPGSNTFGGTLTQSTDGSGVATFSGLVITGPVGAYTIRFNAGADWPTADLAVTLTVGAASALSITTQPVGGVAIGVALPTQPVVRVVDSAGNVRTSDTLTITATRATGSSSAVLANATKVAVAGVATFTGLAVNNAGGNFTLTFSDGTRSVTSSSFSINLTSQAITFGPLTNTTFGGAAFGISASTTSNLVIAFSSTTPAVCSVTGNTTASAGSTGAVVTLLGAGTCTIATNQAGNHVYSAAGQQTQSFTVNAAAQAALTLTNASSVTFGDTLTLKTSGGSGTGAVSYALVGGAGTAQCSLNPTTGAMTFGAAGTCSVRATKAADTNYTSIQSSTQLLTVAKAPQTTSITSSVPANPLPGGDYTVTATASSGLTATVAVLSGTGTVCSLTGSKVSFLAAGTCVVIATQAGNGNYLAADPEDTQTIVVGSLNQSITFAQPANMEFGDPDVVVAPTASSGLPVTVTSETATVCTVSANKVSIVTVGRCELKATQSGDTRYAAASDEVRVFDIIAVVPNSPTISSASASSGAITVKFVAPSFDGGAAILGYRLTATPTGGGTVVTDNSCVTSPCTINGLANGTEYTVTVAALNEAGTGSSSTPSPALTPVTNAMAVQALVAAAGDTTLAVSWTTPADLGGGTFTRYEVRIRATGGSWPGVATQSVTSSSTTSATLTGLDNGTEYEVQVVTITSANAESYEGNTAVVISIPRRVPSSPRELTASRTTPRGVLVSWSVPASNGGAPITAYTVTLSGGATCGTVTVSATTQAGSCTATGLSLDTTYTVTVVAVNVAGSSSAVSTTYTTPSYPTPPTPAPTPPCASCIGEPFDGPDEPDTTPKDAKPGRITLTDGVVTVVLEAAAGTDAVVNADKQLEFALGGKLSAIGTGALATTTMATWWNRTATATGTVSASGGATVEITLPTGTTAGVASVRVDVVSSLGVQRAFYFAVKVVAASSTTATTTNDATSTTTTTTTVPGSPVITKLPNQDVTKPRKPAKSGTFEPGSGESEMLSSTGKVSKAKTVKTPRGIKVEGGGVTVGISPSKGTKMAKNTSGQMVISGTGKLKFSKSGLKPGSKVVVWLRPSMKRLAVAKVKADGTIDVDVTLPDDLPAGDHMLQIDMVNADGEQVSIATGFSMSANRIPVTGSDSVGGVSPGVLLLLLGIGLLLGRRRLRSSPSL